MKIREIETILIDEFPNIVYVRIHTDEGIVGLGESYFGARTVASWIHEMASPYLLGQDPLQIDKHWQKLNPFVGFNSTSVDMRARSAIDVALWDILGQASGQSICTLLGGRSRDRILTYNTCAGSHYTRKVAEGGGLPVRNWGLGERGPDGRPVYEDLDAFMERADELALSLLEQGITGMKIWPFDPYAESSGGHDISTEDLRKGCEPFRRIRSAVGDRMRIMVELHGLWNLPSAMKIAHALEEFEPTWFEDPIKADDLGAIARFARSTRVPTAVSETLGTRWSFRQLLDREAAGVVIFDPTWTGGISEGKKIATLAESYQIPFAPHDCVGPVGLAAAVHLSINGTNALVQETVRAFYTGWYKDLVTEVPLVKDGYVYPMPGTGLGTELLPDVFKRRDMHRASSKLEGEHGAAFSFAV